MDSATKTEGRHRCRASRTQRDKQVIRAGGSPFFVLSTKKDEDSDVRGPEFKFQFCPNLMFSFLNGNIL